MHLLLVALVLVVVGSWGAWRGWEQKQRLSAEPAAIDVARGQPLVKAEASARPTATTFPTRPPLPQAKQLTGGTQVFQTFNNCGPAALSMALSHYDIRVDQGTLGRSLRPYQHPTGDNDDKSVTLAELAAKAKEYGFVVYHRPAGTMEVVEQLIAQDIPVIARTWLKPNEDIGHYRVITGYNRGTQTLIQDDSLQGANLTYTYDDFLELWQAFNYEFLILVPPEKQATVEGVLGDLTDEQVAWERAVELAEQELKSQPENVYAQFNLAVAQTWLGNYQAAIEAFEEVENQLPSRMLWYQIEPLVAYYHLGQTDKVMSLSQSILTRNNRAFSELYYLQGTILQGRGQSQAAQAAFERARMYNSSSYWQANIPLQ